MAIFTKAANIWEEVFHFAALPNFSAALVCSLMISVKLPRKVAVNKPLNLDMIPRPGRGSKAYRLRFYRCVRLVEKCAPEPPVYTKENTCFSGRCSPH